MNGESCMVAVFAIVFFRVSSLWFGLDLEHSSDGGTGIA